MTYTSRNTCAACNRPLIRLASVRIEYRVVNGQKIVDEIDTDATRCMNRACRYSLLDLAELVATASDVLAHVSA